MIEVLTIHGLTSWVVVPHILDLEVLEVVVIDQVAVLKKALEDAVDIPYHQLVEEVLYPPQEVGSVAAVAAFGFEADHIDH